MKKLYTSILIACIATTGNAQNLNSEWVVGMGGAEREEGNSITTDVDGNVYTIGFFEETIYFDLGSGVQNLTSMGDRDVFIQKSDADGNLLWVKQIGGIGEDIGRSICVPTNVL